MVIHPGNMLDKWGEDSLRTGRYKKANEINGVISLSMEAQRLHAALAKGCISPQGTIIMITESLGFASTTRANNVNGDGRRISDRTGPDQSGPLGRFRRRGNRPVYHAYSFRGKMFIAAFIPTLHVIINSRVWIVILHSKVTW